MDYQNAIYDIVKDTQRVFEGIFLLQIIGTTVICCTQAYLLTQVEMKNCLLLTQVRLTIFPLQNIAGFISYMVLGITSIFQLLVYTYFGTMVTTAHEELFQVMLADWYHYDAKKRRLMVVVLISLPKKCGISFQNLIYCSQPTLRMETKYETKYEKENRWIGKSIEAYLPN